MAGIGPPPKDPERRRGHSPDPVPLVVIRSSARGDAPPLGAGFSEATRRWWRAWAESPQGSLFTGTDWGRLQMVAFLVEAYFASPSVGLMAEIRLNESRFGATVVDRQRLRWRIVK